MGLLFAHPEWLSPLVAGLIALTLAVLLAFLRGRRRLRALVGAGSASRGDAPREPLRDAAPLLALALVAVGLLGPRAGESIVRLSTSGVDVVLLLDTSRSMDARDVPPSRIDAGRAAAAQLLDGLRSTDRAALAAFSGRGLLITPLTPDHDALQETLSAIDTTLVKPGGSDLSAGIAQALRAFDPDDSRPRAIVVLSDGEVEGGRRLLGEPGAVAARRADAPVYAVVIGTEAGASVPDHGVPLRDAVGQIVTSRRRTATLEKLADESGGRLFAADEWGHVDVDALVEALRRPVAAVPGSFVPHRVTVPIVLPFAAAAFALLGLEWLQRGRRRAPRASRRSGPSKPASSEVRMGPRAPRPSAAAVALVAGLSLLLTGADARDPARHTTAPDIATEPDAATLFRAGLALADAGEWEQAEHAFLAAAVEAGSPEIAATALHNLGVAALEQDDLETARDAFFDALAARGRPGTSTQSRRTQWNLEWVLGRLAEAAPPEPPPAAPEALPEETGPNEDPASERPEERSEPNETPEDRGDERGEPAPGGHAAREPGGTPSSARETTATPAGEPTPLDEEQRKQWLARVTDDPRKAMLSAAFEGGRERTERPRGAPTW